MSFLKKIRKEKLREIKARKKILPLEKISSGLKKSGNSFRHAVSGKGVRLIAEFKKSSPSKGGINKGASLKEFIQLYDEFADAISILTESKHFSGKIDFIKEARKYTGKPILRKDFILDPYQVYEARYYGADAVLLIADFLSLVELKGLVKVAEELGMDALVECDDEKSLGLALASGSKLIGINNRNLDSLKEDSGKAVKLAKKIPNGLRKKIILVAESAISTRKQVASLDGIVDCILVGTSIMGAPVPRVKIKELMGKTLVKICGVTSKEDALNAVKLGADLIGLNFYEKSPRFISIGKAREIAKAVKGKAVIVGVFVNEAKSNVLKIAKAVGLDALQFSGDEKPNYVKGFKLPVIKAIHVKDSKSVGFAGKFDADYIMLDSYKKGFYGGTGKIIERKFIGKRKLGPNLVLSGGLNADNVSGMIREFSPAIADVCSGVEKELGKKSFSKMKSFIANVRGVEA